MLCHSGGCPLVSIDLDVSLGPKFTPASVFAEADSGTQKERAENWMYLISSNWISHFFQRLSLSLCPNTHCQKAAFKSGTISLRHCPLQLFISTSPVFTFTFEKPGLFFLDPLEDVKDIPLPSMGFLQGLCKWLFPQNWVKFVKNGEFLIKRTNVRLDSGAK